MDLFEESAFGRFDPSNFGLNLNVDAALNHQNYLEFGPLMWTTFQYPISEEHKAYIAAQTTSTDAVFAASCFTVFTHEKRHFHDLLVTPYGSMLMRLYTRAALLYNFMWDEIYFRRKAVVVPLRDWITSSLIFERRYPDVESPPQIIRDVEEVYREQQENLKIANRGLLARQVDSPLPTAEAILEGSAIIVQQLTIAEHFGIEQAEKFGQKILQGPAAERYYGAIKLIHQFAGQPVPFLLNSFLLLASLCGNFLDRNPEHLNCPTDILVELLTWLRERGVNLARLKSFGDLYKLVNEYFVSRHDGDLVTMIDQATYANQGMYESLSKAVDEWEAHYKQPFERGRRLLAGFANFCEVQAVFAKSAILYAEDYCSGAYRKALYHLPSPVISIETRMGIPIDDDDLLAQLCDIKAEDQIHTTPAARDQLLQMPNLNEAQREWLRQARLTANGDVVLRFAFVLSPKTGIIEDQQHAFDLEVWKSSRDLLLGLRLFLEGPNKGESNKGISKQEQRAIISALNLMGTKVYTIDGELIGETPDLSFLPVEAGEMFESLRNAKQRRNK